MVRLLLFYFMISFSIGISKSAAQNLKTSTIELSHIKVDSSFLSYFETLMPFFPELNEANIHVKQRKQMIPLTTTPSIGNVFRKKRNWKYTIAVSTESLKFLNPIIVKNLSDSSKIGVLGHELSHVSDFHTHGRGYMIKVFLGHISSKYLDRFEFETDHIAIKHGLGKYLYAWSAETSEKIKQSKFKKQGKERYMMPNTIILYMKKYPEIYLN
jgi:hypothetical protein